MKSDNKLFFTFLGDRKVGKTSLLKRISENTFNENELPSIDNEMKYFFEKINNEDFLIELWEIVPEMEEFEATTNDLVNRSSAIFLVIDGNNHESFDKVQYQYHILKKKLQNKNVFVVINKIDLTNTLNKDELEKFIHTNDLKYFYVSAKTKENIGQIKKLIDEEIEKKIKIVNPEIENQEIENPLTI